ncbi:hypothetical protein SAMN05444149_101875 [Pseudosulfitobacter pseudonitzschiae]|uniref:Uncharacterized protein n=1 Tax=Pseudosulfitobacter pseudonitzschiae TaxID=1402135 RepID=A0A073J498_9RHOB|nr:hypothetical protein [Pseudosulfitobacter pseudonitzschiae]KEJ97443.1 hypothetical protein SUH3_00235 [Pseudosulfitobacter pseudonitzschiae]QKS08736.1 hypothetical protein HT745_09725 [Pseudosulfitobacter pseudonitzschiae]SHE70557.1 hypothetical protein SAMN05444149_101875 [Pseudosulfitobacter pseudonitzschiae]
MTEDEAAALADDLIQGYPGGKPAVLYMQGMRDLMGADADAYAAFEDRFAELTGYRATAPDPVAVSVLPKPARLSEEEMREAVQAAVADAFSAPFDGTKRRMKTLIDRARGNCAHMDAPHKMVRDAIAEEERALWEAWND